MTYDHIAFHYTNDFPDDLAQENAVHHIGFYFAWAVSQGLHNPEWAQATPDFAKLQKGELSGPKFVMAHMGGELSDDDFNELGNRFTRFYYEDEEEGYGLFIEDYFNALGLESEDDFYRTEDTAENQAKLNRAFQTGFDTWLSRLK
ncbi:DUF7832 domain-containing protein [Neisseria wadsworthii]|uniref:DUF7832 domain-containing protein n=1 Tax=Neisseria wadsworthii 9715 TaxID=1030841 RepID=G4CNM5_9NEIS|nr:hypothetical protein [Neisseria wadsworthii]EGZ49373.1 hypothetical protein HMPREF9370_0684 [Neisseria wadsworthii 9715]QMT36637.1 hypothetical protein H3L96_05410 [Neisseria wadsworthii]